MKAGNVWPRAKRAAGGNALPALVFLCILPVVLASCAGKPGKSRFAEANELYRLGMREDAVRAYRKIIARDPRNTAARFNLAVVVEESGEVEEAESEYRAVLEIDPDHVFSLINLAGIREAAGDAGEAEYLLTRARSVSSGNLLAHWALARFYLNRGRTSECETLVDVVYAADPEDMTANYFRGRLREGAGDAEGALAAYETALAADRSDIEILLRAARLYVVLEKDNSALHALLRATVYTPDSYDAHFALGFLYYLRGNYERALASLWRARELAGEFSVDMSRLIACVYQKAQKAEIRTALDEEEGENPWACHDLLVERLSTLEEVDKIDMGYAGLDDERRLLVFELGVSADSMSGK